MTVKKRDKGQADKAGETQAASPKPQAALTSPPSPAVKVEAAHQLKARIPLGGDANPDLKAIFERITARLGDAPKLVLAKDSTATALRFYAQTSFNFGEIKLVSEPVAMSALGQAVDVKEYWKDKHAALLGHKKHIAISYDLTQPFKDHAALGQMIGAVVESAPAIAVNWVSSGKTVRADEYLAFCKVPMETNSAVQLMWWGMSALAVKGTGGEDGVLIATKGLTDFGLKDIECATARNDYEQSGGLVRSLAMVMVQSRTTVPDGHVENIPFPSGLERTVAFRHVPSVLDANKEVIRLVW